MIQLFFMLLMRHSEFGVCEQPEIKPAYDANLQRPRQKLSTYG